MSTRCRTFAWLSKALLVALASLSGCDQSASSWSTAADEPTQFAATRERSARTLAGRQPAAAEFAAPGAGIRQGSVRGVNAGHLGLEMVYTGIAGDAGVLVFDRLESAMNMDLLQQTIDTYASFELPSSDAEQLAFRCNAYNANALAILSMFAIDSPRATPGKTTPIERTKMGDEVAVGKSKKITLRERFDVQPVLIANELFTMRELRELILGQGDPRVLAYLIDAGDGPVHVPRASLWPKTLDEQLDSMSEVWVNESAIASIVDGELRLCPMLELHAGAFEGETYGGVLGFLQRYADPVGPLSAALKAEVATN